MARGNEVMAGALALLLGACASGTRVAMPEPLEQAAGESLAMVVPAKGVQIYECRAGKDGAAGFAWEFVAPEARLFDAQGNAIGRHGAGPHWESVDGSRIEGTVKARADAPVAGAIPWLLLAARSVGPEGAFSRVTRIRRVNTDSGVAPPSGCTRDTAGTTARVHYTADYLFYTGR